MGISTISFDKAKIYKNKMLFTVYAKNGIYTRVFDSNGNNIMNRIAGNPIRQLEDDRVTISRKISYEYPNRNMVVKVIKRIYDTAGKFIKTEIQTTGV